MASLGGFSGHECNEITVEILELTILSVNSLYILFIYYLVDVEHSGPIGLWVESNIQLIWASKLLSSLEPFLYLFYNIGCFTLFRNFC